MNELHLQDKFLIPFITDEVNGLGYKEVKANTITNTLIIEEDLLAFISQTELNQKHYPKLLKKYHRDEKLLVEELVVFICDRLKNYRNMALFINDNKSVTFQGVKLHLFYTSGSEIHGDALFEQNIFSVVQELPYRYDYKGKKLFAFRPDISFFVNGIFLGYSELKSNYTNQSAKKNGRAKVIKDYQKAVRAHEETVVNDTQASTNEKESFKKAFFKVFDKAIHITTTDIGETHILRNITDAYSEAKESIHNKSYDNQTYIESVEKVFKPYPMVAKDATKSEKLKEVFTALYGKKMIEKEILYYNFIEREIVKKGNTKEAKNERGRLISPRPKQKFGVDKIMRKLDEFLAHETEEDYFINKLRRQLEELGASEKTIKELVKKREAYSNNKNIYSLLLQYAAGFGKSNIIGWAALQLKDIKREGVYVYDKVMLIVDRVQLRDQLGSKMYNMNIEKKLFVEAENKARFLKALKDDTRLVIVNLQKFGTIREILDDEVLERLVELRIVFLIDEIHRSNTGEMHQEMVSIFDEIQGSFDGDKTYKEKRKKKNLIIGFTATPSDNTLARFGEFSGHLESPDKYWVPFDNYTMREAIEDGYILNPLRGIVPVASKMIFGMPENLLEGFETEEKEHKDIGNKKIYENMERIEAIANFVAKRLVQDTYRQIHGQGKGMLAVYSIKSAIAYKNAVESAMEEVVADSKYEKYKDAPIYIVYSSSQDVQNSSSLNRGLTEAKVLQEFAQAKNGLIIVVEKLQTGFDEPKLHTLFLDKEIQGINAIQTISRVNRTTKYKNDCKIVDCSYKNVNVNNIKAAFEHFSDVVVSDFDPFGELNLLQELYGDLIKSDIYEKFFEGFEKLTKEGGLSLDFEESIEKYIHSNPKRVKMSKEKISKYFRILKLLEFVIAIDKKYSDKLFLDFFRKFNMIYNRMNQNAGTKDEIEVYFDDQIGIVEEPAEDYGKQKKKKGDGNGTLGSSKKHKYNILGIIEARNEEEEFIAEQIQIFEQKIDDFFDYLQYDTNGKRLVSKIQSHFAEEEIYSDFKKLYNKYTIVNRQELGAFFIRETKSIVNKLCDDFERVVLA
jgi:type I restriction enzyme R subunit